MGKQSFFPEFNQLSAGLVKVSAQLLQVQASVNSWWIYLTSKFPALYKTLSQVVSDTDKIKGRQAAVASVSFLQLIVFLTYLSVLGGIAACKCYRKNRKAALKTTWRLWSKDFKQGARSANPQPEWPRPRRQAGSSKKIRTFPIIACYIANRGNSRKHKTVSVDSMLHANRGDSSADK